MALALFPVALNSSKRNGKVNSWSFRSLKGRTDVVELMVMNGTMRLPVVHRFLDGSRHWGLDGPSRSSLSVGGDLFVALLTSRTNS
jgi:hypothetical protein